ncbi:hypothetical protein ABNC11_20440 [Paenibacillus larvae]|nr:hypothetical protein [Paenibacillus larvae]MCY7476099.1 hypothetical protein [Paenibacillus larvae]
MTVTHGVLKLHTALLKLSALWRLTVTHGVLKLEMKALCEQKELGLTVTQGVLKRVTMEPQKEHVCSLTVT